ncbi:MAG: cell division protein ZapA [Desulfonauticus sp.]|nr:cell division protein ZapA [Desulfonauticus sp.]
MPGYTLNILGVEISFKTDAPAERVNRAKVLLEERFKVLEERGRKLSREKLLIYLSLGLADDYLLLKDQALEVDKKIAELLDRLDSENI